MPTLTAPYVETQQVVTGYMYQLHIAEESSGPGITRLDIGPYYFPGVPPRVKYPEAVTNEMCPPGWQGIRWVTDDSGASWLRWEGGILRAEDGEAIFQLTSNYPARDDGGPALHVWRSGRKTSERYAIPAPDYSQAPPAVNPRHDVIGKPSFAARSGCAPVLVIAGLGSLAEILRHCL